MPLCLSSIKYSENFHKPNCQRLICRLNKPQDYNPTGQKQKRTLREISLEKCVAKGLVPCIVCHIDEKELEEINRRIEKIKEDIRVQFALPIIAR